ncbi:hypothetical protein HGRIS_010041 [Hohenbuehelia grisea]|uniref:F-box domain-containing protein n=1 Tax=Hohenbuehelia grisea TaxID=104357 RepID=A0ABR3J3F8_9AGAR
MGEDMQTSPFASALGTSYIPSMSEIDIIRTHIERPIGECDDLQKQIDDAQSKLDALIAQRDEVQSYVQSHKALTSLGRRLPGDVLAEIFLQCLPTEHNPACHVDEPPLLFGRVCRSWREVSMSTPRLWAAIHIVVPRVTSPKVYSHLIRARCAGIRAWLTRSGGLPLSISLVLGPERFYVPRSNCWNPAPPKTDFKTFFSVLMDFSRRWKILKLAVADDIVPSLSSVVDTPLLETLKLLELNDRYYQPSTSLLQRNTVINFSRVHPDCVTSL